MTTDVSSAIETILGRMETNPSEFFDSAYKWRFVFKELFLDVLTDAEKTALNDGMTRVRRTEFNSLVLHTALSEPIETTTIQNNGAILTSQYNPTMQNQQSAMTASQYNTAQYHAAQQRTMLNNAGMGVAQQASHSPLQNAMAGQGQNMYGLANSNGIK